MPSSSNPTGTSFCVHHPGRLAIDHCAKCGQPMCAVCQVVFKGQMYCQSCASGAPTSDKTPIVRKPVLAALLSFCIPGLGQIYNGQIGKALIIFLTSWLIVPWIYGVFEAFSTANKINRRIVITSPATAYLSGCLVILLMLSLGPFLMFKAFQQVMILRQVDVRGVEVRHNLRTLSKAIEAYARDKGEYPSSYEDLYFANPPYIDDIYCGTEIDGYRYRCIFSKDGYTIRATPLDKHRIGYTIGTGGGLVPDSGEKGNGS